jgi:alpha-ketoglutaric semialdehyde dehydrogenase
MVACNYIAGEWVEGPETLRNLNPSDVADLVGEYAQADVAQTEQAIEAARRAFRSWSLTPGAQRGEILHQAATEIIARKEELGYLLAREEGKTLSEGMAEVARAGQIFRFFAGEAVRNTGEVVESLRSSTDISVFREPLGVVALITPWNFPMAIPAWKIAPALAYGNTVIFKPAELVPASAWALTDILVRAGLPEGVFNLAMGRGAPVGKCLASSPRIDAISFTGSTQTGREVLRASAENGVRCQLEMGGKNALVVLDDADLSLAVDCAIQGAFGSAGQRCTASSRLIVTSGIHDRFLEEMLKRMGELRVGHALDKESDMGPVISEEAIRKIERHRKIAEGEGARLAAGGSRLQRKTKGYFFAPTLFASTSSKMRINREEVFGPVATIIKAGSYEEALEITNDTPYGLCAGIVTDSLTRAAHFRRNAEIGVVTINAPTAGLDFHVPFGGRKISNYGLREQGRYAREFYTAVKTVYQFNGAAPQG